MEENKILKVIEKVPSGTKLYSTAFGKLEFNGIVATIDGSKIELATWSDICITYFSDGKYRKEGEITLYPSKEMRDWDKFAWKKGDVLRRESDKTMVLFEKFTDDTYTTFFGKYFCKEASITSAERKVLKTEDYSTSTRLVKEYICTIEATFGGKLNLKTLEVEKQPKFKDGDILTCPSTPIHNKSTFIFKKDKEWEAYGYPYYAAAVNSGELYINNGNTWWCGKGSVVRYATEEEKTKLFNALTKEGKRWNAEKKVIEDTKPKPKKENATYKKVSDKPEHEFQPFEKVLVRDVGVGKWIVDLYGIKNEGDPYPYRCVGGCYAFCIPYEGNEHLLGTTNSQEE